MTTKINPKPSDKDVEKSLAEVIKALASHNDGSYEKKMRKEMAESADSHLERVIGAYITTIEGSP